MIEINFDKIQINSHYITEMYAQPFQEFNIYQEEGDTTATNNNANAQQNDGIRSSKVTVSTHDDVKTNAEKAGNKMDFGKRISMLLKRFITWLSNMKQRVVEVFSRNFNAQTNYVEKNAELNKEIATAIDGKTFNPKVENFPIFKIPLAEIKEQANTITKRLKPYYDNNWSHVQNPDINEIRALIYPDTVLKYEGPKKVTESFYMKKDVIDYWTMEMEGQESAEGETKEQSKIDPNADDIKKKLEEYFLFGTTTNGGLNDDSHYTNQLTGQIWLDTCQNIIDAKKAIEIGITGLCDALKQGGVDLDKIVEKTQDELTELEKVQDNSKDKEKENKKNYIIRCQNLSKCLVQISNEYAVGFANTMQEMFFKKSYNLYKDIVTEYRNTKDAFNKQQPDQQQNPPEATNTEAPVQNAAEGTSEVPQAGMDNNH